MVKLYLQHCSRTVQPKYSDVCSAFYGGLFPDPGREDYNASCSDSQAVSTFTYVKNLPLMNQTRVLSSVELACCFSDHKYRHGFVYSARYAMQHVKTQYKSL